MIAPDSTVICTLRIKTAVSDRLAARQQTERALQAAALRPIGLPRDAILIVRRLTARRPDRAGWEQAVNAQLDQLARQAARPIEGAVPANAAAVLFADRAELLACLAADWCAGVVRTQWWWQSLLRGGDLTRAVSDAWLATPEYLPLALQRLAVQRQVTVFAQRLSDEDTRLILHALVQTFGLYELSIRLAEFSEPEPEGHDVIAQHRDQTTSSAPASVRPMPPWLPWIQTRVEHLSPHRQVLLGVGLMLHAAPSIVRSASFAAEVKAWHTAIRRMPPQQRVSPESTAVSSAAPSSSATTAPTPLPQAAASRAALARQPEAAITSAPSLQGALLATQPSPPEQPPESSVGESEVSPSSLPQAATAPLTTRDGVEVEPLSEIETDFGGVCYFINLGLFLNLYGDFTTPLQPGLDLPIWDFMALVAQELIGDDVTRDPIWPLLAQLADRAEDEPPGAHFDPTRNVIARSVVGDEAISLDENGDGFAPTGLAMTPLKSWLADLMSIIRPRLQLALGVNDEDLPRYFTQRARLVVSTLTFDAYFALADLPIEIRLSGLDRDPGWVPAAGRTVRFHYD
jgi:hypothetical protein